MKSQKQNRVVIKLIKTLAISLLILLTLFAAGGIALNVLLKNETENRVQTFKNHDGTIKLLDVYHGEGESLSLALTVSGFHDKVAFLQVWEEDMTTVLGSDREYFSPKETWFDYINEEGAGRRQFQSASFIKEGTFIEILFNDGSKEIINRAEYLRK